MRGIATVVLRAAELIQTSGNSDLRPDQEMGRKSTRRYAMVQA